MIFKGSRYEKVKTYQTVAANGQTVTVFGIRFIPTTPAGFLHPYSTDERLDLLAYRFYGNPEKFWLIADANNEMDAEELTRDPGRNISIPPDRS